jgi:hypothetical protein
MNHLYLKREADRLADLLHAALVSTGKARGRPCHGINAAMAEWRSKRKPAPKINLSEICEAIAALAVEADDAARAASRAYHDSMAEALDKVRAKREEAAAAEVERRRALRDERAEQALWKGL